MAASSPSAPASMANMAPPPVVTFEDLDNSVRNGKKKLYWSAFEVVLVTTQPHGEAPVETRYDAYQVNHNHLKKLHAGARGPHYVRVECKYCTAPRFTQSITVSTKKFEEHYMTLHALDALASADAKKAQQQQQRKSSRSAMTATAASLTDVAAREEEMEGEEDGVDGEEDEEGSRLRSKRTRRDSSAPAGATAKRARRGALTKDDDDHVAAMQGAAAAVVALSGGNNNNNAAQRAVVDNGISSEPSPHVSKTAPRQHHQPLTTTTATALPSSLVDSSIVLDPADSDTKRAKKSYWTAYEVVICERVPRATADIETPAASSLSAGSGEIVTRETRQDAWRVNHNALRRLHLDPENDTTVRVECRFCDEPKFNQSITVSTRKFEQHYCYEHGDENQRQELEGRLAARAAGEASALTDGGNGASQDSSVYVPKRRKSWKALLMDRENAAAAAYATGITTGAKAPYAGVGGSHARGAVSARHQCTLLMNWMLEDYLPLSSVGSDHFQAFVATLDRKFEPPQQQALHSELQQRFDAACRGMKTQIEGEVKAGTAFALAVDQFPVRSSGEDVTHVSITVHFISREWERKQMVLASRAVGAAASLEAVWVVVRGVLDEFGFPESAFASVTVRSNEAMGQAVKYLAPLGARLRKPIVPIILCAASALHEIVDAGVSVLRRAVPEFEAINTLQQQEALEASTWTELYAYVNSIALRYKPSADSEMPTPMTLSPEAVATAQDLVELLEPFVRIAEDMSRTAYPTIPMIFQYFRHMKETITQRAKTNETSNDQLAPVVKAMHAALGKSYENVVHSKALIAYVLDPRFRFAHVSSMDESSIRAQIAEAIAAIMGENDDGHSEQGEDSTGSSSGATRQTRSLFEELATSGKRASIGAVQSAKQDASTATASSLTELEEYLSLEDEEFNVNVLQWWQSHETQFPTLAQVARRYLGLVGTSLPAAELFTRAGQQLAARRSALSPETLEATVVVRAAAESIGQTQPSHARPKTGLLATEQPKRRTTSATPSPTAAAPPPAAATPTPVVVHGANDTESLAVIV